jgi:hypothetical protein
MQCCRGRADPRAGPSVYACTASWFAAIGGRENELSSSDMRHRRYARHLQHSVMEGFSSLNDSSPPYGDWEISLWGTGIYACSIPTKC